MTRWSTTLALALAAGALTAWWVLVERPRMGAELFPGRIFFSLMREDIERFEILRPGARIVIARGLPGQWRIEAVELEDYISRQYARTDSLEPSDDDVTSDR